MIEKNLTCFVPEEYNPLFQSDIQLYNSPINDQHLRYEKNVWR